MADPDISYSQVLATPVGWSANNSDESQTSARFRMNFTVATGASRPQTTSSDLIDSTNIVYITIGFVGIVDNLMAVLVMLLHRPLRQRLANYFLINKCIQDLITGVFLVLQNTVKKVEQLSGVALEIYCRLWNSKAIFLGLFISSLFSLTAVTFEKYLEIAHPIQHRVKMTKKMVLWSIALLAASAMAFKMAYIIGATQVVNGACKGFLYPSFAVQVLVGAANLLIEYLLPLIVIAFSYAGMTRALRRTVQPASMAAKDMNSKMLRARRNIIKTLITVVLAFIICVSSKEFMLTLQSFNLFQVDYRSWWFVVAQTMAFLTCCIDPIIYLIQYEEFRRGARKLFYRVLPYRKTSVVRDDNETSTKTIEVY